MVSGCRPPVAPGPGRAGRGSPRSSRSGPLSVTLPGRTLLHGKRDLEDPDTRTRRMADRLTKKKGI